MKKTLLIILTIASLFIGVNTYDAKEISAINSNQIVLTDSYKLFDKTTGTPTDPECESLFGDPEDPKKKSLAYYLQLILEILKYVGIVLCIVLTVVDFAKALLSEEKDLYKGLAKKAVQRLIYAICLFFLPIFVKTILLLIGVYGTCGIG